MEKNKYTNIIFLDMDGVLNCEVFYKARYSHITRYNDIPLYKTVKKYLRKLLKNREIGRLDYYKSEICPDRMAMLNDLCEETNTAVVISASIRNGKTVEELREIFQYCGATFTIIDKTDHTGYERGTEISKWLHDNCDKWFDVKYYDFYRYAIIDDDSDMLLNQQFNFFQTDNYMGLTPTTCYKIKNFFTHKTF